MHYHIISGCYHQFSLRGSDYFEAVDKFVDPSRRGGGRQTCLNWHDVINNYKGPARWKYTPIDLPDASVIDAQNYCRVLANYPFHPVCFGRNPNDAHDHKEFVMSPSPKAFLKECDIPKCPNTGRM